MSWCVRVEGQKDNLEEFGFVASERVRWLGSERVMTFVTSPVEKSLTEDLHPSCAAGRCSSTLFLRFLSSLAPNSEIEDFRDWDGK